jgi:membrane protein YdbS with pleckstrin-like domain
MPNYILHTPEGKEGPYTDVDLLDLLDRDLLDPATLCQLETGGDMIPVADLFEVIYPDSMLAEEADAANPDSEEDEQDADDEEELLVEDDIPEMPENNPLANGKPEEVTLYTSHMSWLVFWPFYFVSTIAVGVGWYSSKKSLWPLFVGISVLVISHFTVWLLRSRHSFLLTNRRVEMVKGIIIRSSREIRIQDIRAINVLRSGIHAVLGIGTVEFSSAGGTDGEVRFTNVRKCQRIKQLVRKLQ